MSELTETLLITEELLAPYKTSMRLDRLLVEQFPGYSRTYFQYLIASELVLINGAHVKKREIPRAGDEIEICFELTPEISLEPEKIALDLLYEDDHLLVINKPAGLVMYPAPGHPSGTLANALLHHCKSLPCTDTLRPGIVHRLDKGTSGVLVTAKTSEAHRELVRLFASREVTKHYLAVCIGNPGERTIEAPLKRDPKKRQEMRVDSSGKPATSICKTLSTQGDLSLAQIQLITGRTHQVRVHLKHIGTPVLGDPVYGRPSLNAKYLVSRPLLHSHTLSFSHPITKEPLQFEAPIPLDMHKYYQ